MIDLINKFLNDFQQGALFTLFIFAMIFLSAAVYVLVSRYKSSANCLKNAKHKPLQAVNPSPGSMGVVEGKSSVLKTKELLEALNISCPVCGFYCIGKGGHGCIDKPSMNKAGISEQEKG